MILYAIGLAIFAAFLAWRWTVDKWKSLNRWANRLEKKLPRPLRWPPDPITWVHHAAFTLLAGVGTGAWGVICGVGFLTFGAWIMVAFYVVREGLGFVEQWGDPGMFWRGWPHMTGWFVDGVLDVALPLAVAVML